MVQTNKMTFMNIPVEIVRMRDQSSYTHDSGAVFEIGNDNVKCCEIDFDKKKNFIILFKDGQYNPSDLVSAIWTCFFKILNAKYSKKEESLEELSKEIYAYNFSKFLAFVSKKILEMYGIINI